MRWSGTRVSLAAGLLLILFSGWREGVAFALPLLVAGVVFDLMAGAGWAASAARCAFFWSPAFALARLMHEAAGQPRLGWPAALGGFGLFGFFGVHLGLGALFGLGFWLVYSRLQRT